MSRVRDLASILTASSSMATDTEVSAVSAQIPANVAGKNFIINGGFDFWQRGISISSLSGSPQTYTADRWWYSNTPNITGTVSRQPTGDTTNLPSIQYCARVQRTVGNTGVNPLYFCQEIETVNSIPLAGKTVTISFYARKGTNYSQNNSQLIFQLRSGTGVDQNSYSGFTNSTNIIQNQASLLTTVWQRFSYSVPVPPTSTQLGAFFYYGANGTAGVADYFEITGVQLEIGSVATHFSRAGGDIQGELAKCQRYYEKTFDVDVAPANGSTSNAFASANGVVQSYSSGATGNESYHTKFFVPKRIAPSISFLGNSAGLWLNPSDTTSPAMGTRNIGQTGFAFYQQISGSYASTRGHWVASAEL